jgi:hypothetical protein
VLLENFRQIYIVGIINILTCSKCKSFVKHLLRRDLSKRYGNLKNGVQDIKGHRFYEKINW